MSWYRRYCYGALAAVLLAGGCRQERPAIDRVQANALDKELFQGEWQYGRTVVGIEASESVTFVGENGDALEFRGVERIRWDMQESWLYARRSYELVKDGERELAADGTIDGSPFMGATVATYRIESHFDIKRVHNSTTGEEYDVLEENTTDRPWYQRSYMRVDWSKNYATDFRFWVDDVVQDPIAYYVQQAAGENGAVDPDYPVFAPGVFDKNNVMVVRPYADVTNMVMVQPEMVDTPWGTYPLCYFFEYETADCAAVPIKIRHSFLRVDPERQYEPTRMAGPVTDYFGIIRVERLKLNPEQGVNQRDKVAYSSLHNLWKKWRDENGDLLPPKQREVRPIVYYAINWPADVMPTVRGVEESWNKVFQYVVAAAREEPSYDGQVFIVCNSPVTEEDNPLCGEKGFIARIGDLRYNSLVYVPEYIGGIKIAGYGPSSVDPLTGETLQSSVYVYMTVERAVQSAIENIQLLNGDMDRTSYIDGVDLTPWAEEANKSLRDNPVYSQEQIAAIAKAQNFDWVKKLGMIAPANSLESLKGVSLQELMKDATSLMYDRGAFNGTYDDSYARLESLRDTYIENLLLNDEIKMAVDIDPATPLSSFTTGMLRDASIARVGPTQALAAIKQVRDGYIKPGGLDVADSLDDGMWGIAQRFKGMSADEIRASVKEEIFHSLLAHELGHNFSLHHNFGGTEDVVNYSNEYWEIRSNTLAGDNGRVGPRWLDPITDYELEKRIYKHAYSSIMDYSRLFQDYDPGKYDRAAVTFAYANKIEVFKDFGSVDTNVFQQWSQNDGNATYFDSVESESEPGKWILRPVSYHYTNWWRDLGSRMYDEANRMLVDAGSVADWGAGVAQVPGKGNFFRVPYVFCSPFESGIGNGCLLGDYGADEYERMHYHVQRANFWYVSRSFTRYRVKSNPFTYLLDVYDGIYRRFKGFNDTFTLIMGFNKAILAQWPEAIDLYLQDSTSGWAGNVLAQHNMLNYLLQTLAMPDVAEYRLHTDPGGQGLYERTTFPYKDNIKTNIVNARYFTTGWMDSQGSDCGMYYYQCLHHIGFYLDKMMAMLALTDAQTYFVGRDTSEDVRQWRISFFDDYSTILNDFFGGILSEDYNDYAPRRGSDGVIRFPDYADPSQPMPEGTPINPATGFTVQLYTAVLGMAWLQNNFDKSFLESSRMWVAGSMVEADSDLGYVELAYPTNGLTYRALDIPNGVGRRMLERAQSIFDRSSLCETNCEIVDNPALVAEADGALKLYVQLLDIMVDLTNSYEIVTQNYGNPFSPGGYK
ncbi:MAG: hypothetical protein V2A73_14285 [Pseudomonadota bacterium]